MLETPLATRLEQEISDLKGRVQTAADMSEMVRQKALPNAPVTCFVIPAGLRSQGGEAMAGAFTTALDEVLALVLVVRTAGDVKGTKGLVKLDPLVLKILEAVSGWAPDTIGDMPSHPVTGVFRPLSGQVIKLDAGVIFYQLEFACAWQLRVMPS